MEVTYSVICKYCLFNVLNTSLCVTKFSHADDHIIMCLS